MNPRNFKPEGKGEKDRKYIFRNIALYRLSLTLLNQTHLYITSKTEHFLCILARKYLGLKPCQACHYSVQTVI